MFALDEESQPTKGHAMKRLMYWLSVLFLCELVGLLSATVRAANPSNRQADVIQTSRGELRLMPLYHGSVMLEFGGKVIHVDPWSQGDYTGIPPADMIVVTHTHADHLDRAMIDKLHKPSTIIVASPAGGDTLNCAPACGSLEIIGDGEKQTVMGIDIEVLCTPRPVRRPANRIITRALEAGMCSISGDTRVYFSETRNASRR